MPNTLGHSLTVELRTLTPSVLVRIQLPQPKIKTPWWRFCFWFVAMVQSCDEHRLVRKQVDLTSARAVKSSRFPRRRQPRESAAPHSLLSSYGAGPISFLW